MTTQQVQVPSNWEGSIPEYIAYTTFQQLGLRPGEDFSYQSPLLGGRMDKGGLVLDFIFPDRLLAINIQGVYFHYEFKGLETKARDTMARSAIAGEGMTLVFIDDDDLMRDPRYYCQEALNYRDHSRLGGG